MYCCQTSEPGYLPEPYHLPGYGGHIPSMTSRFGGTFGRLSRVALEDPCVAQAPIPVLQAPPCPCPPREDCGRMEDSCGSMKSNFGSSMCGNGSMGVGGNSGSCGSGSMGGNSGSCGRSSPQSCPPRIQQGDSGNNGAFYCRNPPACDDLGCFSPVMCAAPRQQPKKRACTPPPLPCLPDCCDPRAHHLNRSPYACPCRPEPDSNIYRCCESMGSSYSGHVPGFTFHSNGRTFGKATWGTKQYMENCFYFNTFTK